MTRPPEGEFGFEDFSIADLMPPTPETRTDFDAICLDIETCGTTSVYAEVTHGYAMGGNNERLSMGASCEHKHDSGSDVKSTYEAWLRYENDGTKTTFGRADSTMAELNAEKGAVVEPAFQLALETAAPERSQWLRMLWSTIQHYPGDEIGDSKVDELLATAPVEFTRSEAVHHIVIGRQALPDGRERNGLPDGTNFLYQRREGAKPYIRVRLPVGMIYEYSDRPGEGEKLLITTEQMKLQDLSRGSFVEENDGTFRFVEADGTIPQRPGNDLNEGKMRKLNEQLRIVHAQLLQA